MAGLGALKVLVVDDNAHMRAVACALVQGMGVGEAREARDGFEALEMLAVHPADVAIVDFLMSPMDGVRFTRHVRTAPDSPNVYLPIIMMTGYSQRSRVMEARDAGVTEIVAKPVTARALALRINAVLSRPRPFVRTKGYFGPDRRRHDDPGFTGPRRRAEDVQVDTDALAID